MEEELEGVSSNAEMVSSADVSTLDDEVSKLIHHTHAYTHTYYTHSHRCVFRILVQLPDTDVLESVDTYARSMFAHDRTWTVAMNGDGQSVGPSFFSTVLAVINLAKGVRDDDRVADEEEKEVESISENVKVAEGEPGEAKIHTNKKSQRCECCRVVFVPDVCKFPELCSTCFLEGKCLSLCCYIFLCCCLFLSNIVCVVCM